MMKRKWYFYFDQKGFSLAEILITLVIISILAVIGIPHYLKSQRKGMQNEAKILLMELYTKERAFVGEWGFGTPNFHQLGYFPRGNYFYNAGWKDNTIVVGSNVNSVYTGSSPITDYEGPYLPSDLSRESLGYDGLKVTTADLEELTNVKEICKDIFKDESPCIFNPSANAVDILDKFGTGTNYEIEIDNTNSPNTVTFGIGAAAKFDGASFEDQWYINQDGRLKNVQIGL